MWGCFSLSMTVSMREMMSAILSCEIALWATLYRISASTVCSPSPVLSALSKSARAFLDTSCGKLKSISFSLPDEWNGNAMMRNTINRV